MQIPKTTTAEILSYADSNHYLVTLAHAGQSARELVRQNNHEPRRFRGLAEAKSWLRGQGVEEAFLCMESAYDEMVGAPCEPDRIRLVLH